MRRLEWYSAGTGRLALWPRPSHHAIGELRGAGCTHLVTLLSEREGAATIGIRAQASGLSWVWLPLPNGTPPAGAEEALLAEGIRNLAALLGRGAGLLIHCAAGIHRTGMVAYALLRLQGLTQAQALEAIVRMRPEIAPLTSQGLRQKHIEWGERLFGQEMAR